MIDFDFKFRNDKQFRETFLKLQARLNELTEKAKSNTKYIDERRYVLMQLLSHVNFNLGPFLPEYFPKFIKGRPLSLNDRPFAYCFYDLHLFNTIVFRGSRQISKTTNLCARQALMAHLIPGFKSTIITPHPDQIQTYANKLKEMIESYRFFSRDTNFRQNLYYREFKKTKSTIKLTNVLTNVSKIRGISTDEIIYEECQDFDPDLETEVHEIQSASESPVTLYSGTSLTTDTFLEHKYQLSSKGVFCIKCHKCGHWNKPTEEGDVFGMIKPDGPSCVKCSTILNVRNGQFVHEDTDSLAAGHHGYHIPKIIVPAIVEDPRKWNDIFVKSRSGNKKKFLQEVLGIPTEEGAKEITENDLKEICTLGHQSDLLKKAKERRYRYIVSGCDWGGSDHIREFKVKLSYTAHVMLGITEDGLFDILLMRKFDGMNYNKVIEGIVDRHKEYNGYALGSDFGGGQLYNIMLREHIDPSRHWVFTYSGPRSKILNEIPGSIYNHLSLNKTESITATYNAIKERRIRCFNWEDSKHDLKDCLNVFRAPHETDAGQTYIIYKRQAQKSDDILQALNLAYIVGSILIGDSLFEDVGLRNKVINILNGVENYSNSNFGSDLIIG